MKTFPKFQSGGRTSCHLETPYPTFEKEKTHLTQHETKGTPPHPNVENEQTNSG